MSVGLSTLVIMVQVFVSDLQSTIGFTFVNINLVTMNLILTDSRKLTKGNKIQYRKIKGLSTIYLL